MHLFESYHLILAAAVVQQVATLSVQWPATRSSASLRHTRSIPSASWPSKTLPHLMNLLPRSAVSFLSIRVRPEASPKKPITAVSIGRWYHFLQAHNYIIGHYLLPSSRPFATPVHSLLPQHPRPPQIHLLLPSCTCT
jgi:hypothetical protein